MIKIKKSAILLCQLFIDDLFSPITKEESTLETIDEILEEIIDINVKQKFYDEYLKIKKDVLEDIYFTYESDPAASGYEEIVLAYPGIYAISLYRVAHIFYDLNQKILARLISEYAHQQTGIDINPGAIILSPFFIDHGTGVVIGETAHLGRKVKIYQGVTLGALSLAKGQKLKGNKRHPTIGNNVTIYANSTILGGKTYIADNTIIGSNVLITKSITQSSKITSDIESLNIIFE